MSDRTALTDRRGVSEAFALGVLIGMVVLTTGALGVYVLVTDSSGEDSLAINFTYQYFDDTDAVLITHAQGESVPAGELTIEGPGNTVTWAETANDPEDEPVEVGDAIQLSGRNVYGSPVVTGDTFTVYRTTAGNRTQLSEWTAGR